MTLVPGWVSAPQSHSRVAIIDFDISFIFWRKGRDSINIS
jgi:hypothetical protein